MKPLVRLNSNESPWAPEDIFPQIFDINWSEVQLHRYLCQDDGPLLPALATYTGADIEQLIVGNGGDELIMQIFSALSGPQKKIMLNPPTFMVYHGTAAMLGVTVFDVPLTADFQLQTDEMIETINKEDVAMAMICRPNNPTGNIFPKEDIIKILKNTEAYIVVDEAYFEFAGTSMQDELANYPKLVLLRTMSKAFAVAGMRIGYVISTPEVRALIREKQLYYNISSLAQYIGARLLQKSPIYLEYVQKVIQIREEFRSKLNEIPGVTAYPSHTNFFVLELALDPVAVQNYLEEKGILVRKVCHSCELLKNMLRISVGSRTENEFVVEILKKYTDC